MFSVRQAAEIEAKPEDGPMGLYDRHRPGCFCGGTVSGPPPEGHTVGSGRRHSRPAGVCREQWPQWRINVASSGHTIRPIMTPGSPEA